GLIVGLGHYHAELVLDEGLEALPRVDLLPELINYHMQHQVITKIGQDQPKKNGPSTIDIIFNWFSLLMEVGVCAAVTAACGGLAAARVYDEGRGCWAVRSKRDFPLNAGGRLAACLLKHSQEGIAEALAPAPFDKANGYVTVSLYLTAVLDDAE